jgi:hypothetical protein
MNIHMNGLHGVDIFDKNKGYRVKIWLGGPIRTPLKDNQGTKIGQIIFLSPFLKKS